MPLTQTLPFLEEKLVAYLKAYSALNSLISGRVSTRLPSDAVFPAVRLIRSGGGPNRQGIEQPRIDFHCYGRTEQEAHAVYGQVFKATMEMPTVAPTHGTVVVSAAEPLLARFLPDPSLSADRPLPRWILEVLFTAKSL